MNNEGNKQIVGITGPTGSGKSYISNIYKELGFSIIDADFIGHIVLENEAKEEILKTFGTLNRKEIGKIVFSNRERLKLLNNIMHPLIVQRVLNIIEENKKVVIDAALLFETGLDKICTEIVYVLASDKNRLKRIVERDNITIEQAENRIKSQSNTIPNVHFVVYNEYEKI